MIEWVHAQKLKYGSEKEIGKNVSSGKNGLTAWKVRAEMEVKWLCEFKCKGLKYSSSSKSKIVRSSRCK